MTRPLIIFCCFILFFLSNCGKRNTSLQKILTVPCYWDIMEIDSPNPINSCYKFDIEGKCNFYYYNFFDKKRTDSVFLYDDNDVAVPNQWNIEKDSILIRLNKYRIVKYTSDSVFLDKAEGKSKLILIRNCLTHKER